MFWFTPQQIKGANFRYAMTIYVILELVWALFWFISKIYINASMDAGSFVGTRFLSDFNNIGNRLSIPVIMVALIHWMHEPSAVALIPLFGYVLYDVSMFYETLFGRNLTGILPPTHAGTLQIAVMSFAIANSAIALAWYVFYLINNDKSSKKKQPSLASTSASVYQRMK